MKVTDFVPEQTMEILIENLISNLIRVLVRELNDADEKS